jgi:AraC-like DNA-binding protein
MVEGREQLIDPMTAFVCMPGVESQVAHPDRGGHDSLVIGFADGAFENINPSPVDVMTSLPMTPQRDYAFRLLAATIQGPHFDLLGIEEMVTHVVTDLFDGLSLPRPGTAAGHHARRAIVDRAREALSADPTLSLSELAREVAVSPFYLSRLFPQITSRTLSHWRNELRVRMALERIEGGEANLATVAADLGFADHAHMTRVMKDQLGAPPSIVREHLRRLLN